MSDLIWIERNVFSEETINLLKKAFFEVLEKCTAIQRKAGIDQITANTVHHVFLMNPVFMDAVRVPRNLKAVSKFFSQQKFVLNSFGGNNNLNYNYAREIHRDVRFFSVDRLMLNTIWVLSPLNSATGATEFYVNESHILANPPSKEEFEKNKFQITAEPGDIIFFDSRVWHRAGVPQKKIEERIIYTPIYSRPFIKPGFNYAKQLLKMDQGPNLDEVTRQLCGVYSDVPETLEQWYGLEGRRYYHKDQDL